MEACGLASRFVRKVSTASGAIVIQVVTRRCRQVALAEHVRCTHADAELELPPAAARERMSPGQDLLDLGEEAVTATRSQPAGTPA